MLAVLRAFGVAIYLIVLLVVIQQVIGRAVDYELLLLAAPAVGLLAISGLAWLGPREEMWGWFLLTVWLGARFGDAQTLYEQIAFLAFGMTGLMGLLFSPWLIALAWLAHIAWSFFPRELSANLSDLPLASIIIDVMVGAWLAWRARGGFRPLRPLISFFPDSNDQQP